MSRMISQLDSVVVGVNDLSAAAADYAALTGSGAQEVEFRSGSSVSFSWRIPVCDWLRRLSDRASNSWSLAVQT